MLLTESNMHIFIGDVTVLELINNGVRKASKLWVSIFG